MLFLIRRFSFCIRIRIRIRIALVYFLFLFFFFFYFSFLFPSPKKDPPLAFLIPLLRLAGASLSARRLGLRSRSGELVDALLQQLEVLGRVCGGGALRGVRGGRVVGVVCGRLVVLGLVVGVAVVAVGSF